MEPWTQHAWDTDRSPWTLWIIRDSFLNSTISDNILTATAPGSGVEVLALVGDEGHISFRSNTSIRVDSFRQIGLRSGLVCLLSGTLWPMGPRKDGRGLCEALGGTWTPGSRSLNASKWTSAQRDILCRLFDNPRGWDVMLFRRLITLWYLCRDIDATWSGEYIIPRSHKRPVPGVIVPDDAEMESALTEKFQRTKLGRIRDGGGGFARRKAEVR